MPTAKKRGDKWRVQVYAYTDERGVAHTKSFTASTKKEAERLAAQYVYTPSEGSVMALGDAMDKYIESRVPVLSPTTIASYRGIRKNYCKEIVAVKIDKLTNDQIQRAINHEVSKLSPKTIRNISGLISATLRTYRPDFAYSVKLPQKVRPDLVLPEDEDIRKLLEYVAGTPMELPILLAAFGPMRRGEIAALRYENISGDIVHVCENMVIDGNGGYVVKATKSYAGDRYIKFPDFVAEHFTGTEGSVCGLTPEAISSRWHRIVKALGIKYRFHDLRHYCASILHTMMPDEYIMQRGGWSSDATLKAVYRHALSDEAEKFNDLANNSFTKNFTTKK